MRRSWRPSSHRVEGRADEVRERDGGEDRQPAGGAEQAEGRAADRGEEGLDEAEEDHAGSGGWAGPL